MKKIFFLFCFNLCCVISYSQNDAANRTRLFNAGWRFLKDDTISADAPEYDDSKWRKVDLPHDWSIEDLPNQKDGTVQGPFTKASVGKAATGYTEGGIGWYRKTFSLSKSAEGKQTYISFDGVYMNADVWVNGQHAGNHPYGYTSFSYNLTKYLNADGKQNVIAVRTKNLGKNSRWYSGSGIYRHVWLTSVNEVHTAIWGTYITTPNITPESAKVKVENTIRNGSAQNKKINLQVELISPSGQVVSLLKKAVQIAANDTGSATLDLIIPKPLLWSLGNPVLYKAKVTLSTAGKIIDQTVTSFGIRSIGFDGQKGFLLNGKVMKLKGGCIHHDNGPLGAVAIDRAEERKIELLKKAGYNALRLSHNPMSPALLDACDRLGMLVVTDAFDMWEVEKLGMKNGYHQYFKGWWQKDLDAMILRDRNHPSIIMWGIGNEIWEAADTSGQRIAKELADEVRRLDPTRALTEAMLYLPQQIKYKWNEFAPHLANLDVDGYNYFIGGQFDPMQRDSATIHRYETEHAMHPQKLFMATEYYPSAALENWTAAEKYPYVIGGFSWTAMDYIGEANIGGPALVSASTKVPQGLMSLMFFFKPESWPVFNSHCGDLDLIGNRKAASYYQNVVWRNSPIEMLVHQPIPDGMKEVRSPWGFPNEFKSWTWPGNEDKKIQVNIYSRAQKVMLELNGKIVGEQTMQPDNITASFDVTYQPGTLIAKSFIDGKQTGENILNTVGKPVAIRLKADRNTIKANRNDLSYISVEVTDDKGNVVPYIDDLLIKYHVEGNGEIAGVGNGNSADLSSFQQPQKKVFHGRGLVIIRPKGNAGKILLKAEAAGLAAGTIVIITK